MTLYETVFVLDPQLKSHEIEENVKKFTSFITNHGGEIVKHEEWGKRRLAYEINRKQYGYYVLLRFQGPGQLVSLLEREYRLSENVLRYLTIKVDKKALEMEAFMAQKAAEEEQAAKDAEAAAIARAEARQKEEEAAEASDEATEQVAEEDAES